MLGAGLSRIAALMVQLCASGLDGEIGLCKRNFVLLGIAVLRGQIAGVASEHDVIDFTLAARAEVAHFPGVRKWPAAACPDVSQAIWALFTTLTKFSHFAYPSRC